MVGKHVVLCRRNRNGRRHLNRITIHISVLRRNGRAVLQRDVVAISDIFCDVIAIRNLVRDSRDNDSVIRSQLRVIDDGPATVDVDFTVFVLDGRIDERRHVAGISGMRRELAEAIIILVSRHRSCRARGNGDIRFRSVRCDARVRQRRLSAKDADNLAATDRQIVAREDIRRRRRARHGFAVLLLTCRRIKLRSIIELQRRAVEVHRAAIDMEVRILAGARVVKRAVERHRVVRRGRRRTHDVLRFIFFLECKGLRREVLDHDIITAALRRERNTIRDIDFAARENEQFLDVEFRAVFDGKQGRRAAGLGKGSRVAIEELAVAQRKRRENHVARIDDARAADDDAVRIHKNRRIRARLVQDASERRDTRARHAVQQRMIRRIEVQRLTTRDVERIPVDDGVARRRQRAARGDGAVREARDGTGSDGAALRHGISSAARKRKCDGRREECGLHAVHFLCKHRFHSFLHKTSGHQKL